MKKTLVPVLMLAAWLGSCGPKDEVAPDNVTCKLAQSVNTYTQSAGTNSEATIVDSDVLRFNENGDLLELVRKSENTRKSDGRVTTFNSTTTNEYNAEGLLTKKTVINNSYESFQETNTYEYLSGKLVKVNLKQTITNPNFFQEITSVTTYTYDESGEAVKEIYEGARKQNSLSGNYNYTSRGERTFEYTNGKLSKISVVSTGEDGKSYSYIRTFTLNSQGLMAKYEDDNTSISGNKSTNAVEYQYNAEGEVIREDYYTNGVKNRSRTVEYDNKKSWESSMYVALKGHPVLQSPISGKRIHNATKETWVNMNADGSERNRGTTTLQYQYDGNGYPTSVQRTTVSQPASGSPFVVNSTFAYQGCK